MDLGAVCSSWTVPTHVVTVDLDGDGRDEALFTYGNVLYAIGEDDDGGGHLAYQPRAPRLKDDAEPPALDTDTEDGEAPTRAF